MAAGSTLFSCRYVKKATTAIAGATHARLTPSTVVKIDPGPAGSPGPAEFVVTNRNLDVEIFGNDFTTLIALLESAKASIVIGVVGAATANEKITITNVKLVQPIASIDIPENDSGGKIAKFGIKGMVEWGASDTWATVIAAASDAA